MKKSALLASIFLLPFFAHAAPSLVTYTVSNATIYPGSSAATTTAIDLKFSEQVKVTLKIQNSSGTVVRALYSSSSVTDPTPKVWDGTNDSGTRVADGAYTVFVAATSTTDGSV